MEFGVVGGNTRFILYKDEKQRVIEMDILELRKLMEFFKGYQDPFAADNPNHVDKIRKF